jgi:hypothetical protein
VALWKVADAAVQLRRLVVMAVVEREEYPTHDATWTPASGGTSICHAKIGFKCLAVIAAFAHD